MRFLKIFVCAALLCAVAAAQSRDFHRFTLEVEGGPSWNSSNNVRIPPVGGTDFSLVDLIGTAPTPYVRAYATIRFNPKHSLRLLAAPVQFEGMGRFGGPVNFAGETFAAGQQTKGIYQFNTYRFTYGYTLVDRDRWSLKIGAAGLIRDAKVELQQGGKVARDTDLGFVPLAYFNTQYNFTDRTSFVFDVEGLGAPQGRAIDASTKLYYRLTDRLFFGAGYRTIEGGANVKTVYNFAWLNFAAFSLGYDF